MKKSLLIPFLAGTIFFNSCNPQKNLTSDRKIPKQEIKIDNSKKDLEKIIKNFNGKDTVILENKFYKVNLRRNSRTGKKEISKEDKYVYGKLADKKKSLIKQNKFPKFDMKFAQKIVSRYNAIELMPKSLDNLIQKIISNERLFSYYLNKFYNSKLEIYTEKAEYDEAINYLKETEKVLKKFIPKSKYEKMYLGRYSDYLIEKENQIRLEKKQKYTPKPGIYKATTNSGVNLIIAITKYKNVHLENYGKEYDAIKKTRANLVNYVKEKYGKSVKKIRGERILKNEKISQDSSRALIIYKLIQNKKLTKKIFNSEQLYKPYKE